MLKNALPMQAFIRRCWLSTHRISVDQARSVLPPELEPVTHNGFAYLNTVVARMEVMRPQGLPSFLGMDYWHVGYRIYAKATVSSGTQEGLFFLRSDCDRRLLALAGDLLTDFRFHTARIQVKDHGGATSIRVEVPKACARLELSGKTVTALSPGSAFGTLTEAEAFLKYKPYGLAPAGPGRVNAIPIRRDEAAWKSRPVETLHQQWDFLDAFPGAAPELVFEVAPIEYRFGRGRILDLS